MESKDLLFNGDAILKTPVCVSTWLLCKLPSAVFLHEHQSLFFLFSTSCFYSTRVVDSSLFILLRFIHFRYRSVLPALYVCPWYPWKPEETLGPLELELQAVVSHSTWGPGLRCSIRAVYALDCGAPLQPSTLTLSCHGAVAACLHSYHLRSGFLIKAGLKAPLFSVESLRTIGWKHFHSLQPV